MLSRRGQNNDGSIQTATKTQFAAVDLNKQDRIQSNELDSILIWALIKHSREDSLTISKLCKSPRNEETDT